MSYLSDGYHYPLISYQPEKEHKFNKGSLRNKSFLCVRHNGNSIQNIHTHLMSSTPELERSWLEEIVVQ